MPELTPSLRKTSFVLSVFLLISSTAGCDMIKTWFEKTAEQTVIQPIDRASRTKLATDLRTINRALEVFHAQNGRYPDSLDELTTFGAISYIPREPFGGDWIYDRYSGTVKSSTYPEVTPR